MEKKLYRNTRNKTICGVCVGIADYFKIDATLVKLLWAVVALCSCGTALIAYIIAAIIIPEEPQGM